MNRDMIAGDRLTRYLLGLMPEEEKAELEDVCLVDDGLNEEIQAAERDLIDSYLEGTLSDVERSRFESFFLCTPARMEKLRFAKTLRTYGSKLEAQGGSAAVGLPRVPAGILRSFAASRTGIALLVVLAIGLGLVIWRLALLGRNTRRDFVGV